MPPNVPGPLPGKRTVRTIKERGVVYEQRFNTCGKKNCARCNGTAETVLGHGPYWYFCITLRGKWFRIYMGKNLDTSKYRDAEGEPDWNAIRARRKGRRSHPATEDHTPPADPEPALQGEKDRTPPDDEPDRHHCYVCGRDPDHAADDGSPAAAANLCGPCHALGHHPEGSALQAPPPDPSALTQAAKSP